MGLTGRDRGRPARRARILALALTGALAALPCSPARGEPSRGRIALLAIAGYDPVSYFLPGGPQAGSSRFEERWDGRVWRFSSESDRAAFRSDPAVYAPRLGGFDAAGVLERRVVDADPAVFAIVGERLYLFRDAARRARFLADPTLPAAAEAIWPTLRGLLDTPEDPVPGPPTDGPG